MLFEEISRSNQPEGVKIKECTFENCSTEAVVSINLDHPEIYPNETVGICEIPFAAVLVSDLEISSCQVSLSGRFAKPVSFSKWPPNSSNLEISRRGKSGRKCRFKIDEDKILIEEDGRTGEAPTAKKKKFPGPDHDLEILGLDDVPKNEEEVSRAFRKAALLHHPDKTGGPGNFLKLTKAKSNLLARIKK